MAIEEEVPPPKPPPSPSPSPSSIDGSSQRKTKPGTKRLFLTLSVLLSFLSGVPFLLKSTEIHRSPLPFAGAISSRQNVSFPCRFHAVFLPPSSSSSSFSNPQALAHNLLQSTSSSSTCSNVTISVTVDSPGGCESTEDSIWKCGARNGIGFSGDVDDDAVDELLDSRIGGAARIYTVVVAVKEEEVRVVVGKHRHAWIVGRVSEEEAVEMVSEIFVKIFMRGGRDENKAEEDFMPVGLDGNLVLSFSLLNADPNDWVYDWEMQKVEKLILAPVVEALAPIANIRTESQVLYHTPKSSISSWDDNLSSYVFSTRDLPFFVNSNEWHLDTSVAVTGRSKVLQFVVYVPSVDECPLLLRLPNGDTSKTNGFISPMWGGVVVWNPPSCSRNSLLTQLTRNMISPEDMQKIFQVFVGQLRLLFGFKSDYSHVFGGRRFNFIPSVRGFTEWELDVLYRHHACSNLISCTSTLESLSKLVQSLPRMIVKDEIGKQAEKANGTILQIKVNGIWLHLLDLTAGIDTFGLELLDFAENLSICDLSESFTEVGKKVMFAKEPGDVFVGSHATHVLQIDAYWCYPSPLEVKFSLEAASLAQNNASLGEYDASAASSRKARALAEDAFFHPSVMSISYSSIEHYFAIYMPFFAPVSLHVLLAAIKEIKRYKKEKAKYLSFVAGQTTAS